LAGADACTRVKALRGIAEFGAEARSALPALLKTLRDPDAEVHEQTLTVLQGLEPWTAEDIPVLGSSLRDSSPRVRKFAAGALRKTGPAARKIGRASCRGR